MISKAFTKNVQTKGRIRVKYSKRVAIARINAAVDARNRIQYKNFEEPLAILVKFWGKSSAKVLK
jgi:hypothetical protein